jgi:hypothetical protein
MTNLPLWANYDPLNAEKIYSDSKEMEKWCNDSISDDSWCFYSASAEGVMYRSLFGFSIAVRTHIRFLNDEDATAFKIRFKL